MDNRQWDGASLSGAIKREHRDTETEAMRSHLGRKQRQAEDANARQVAGDHYRADYQHWDFVMDTYQNYLQGNATKYISRWRRKNGIVDLEKSLHYLDKLMEKPQGVVGSDAGRTHYLWRFCLANDLTLDEGRAIGYILHEAYEEARAVVIMMLNTNLPIAGEGSTRRG